jgi:hypothetical protein
VSADNETSLLTLQHVLEVERLVTAVAMGWEIWRCLVILDKESIPDILS